MPGRPTDPFIIREDRLYLKRCAVYRFARLNGCSKHKVANLLQKRAYMKEAAAENLASIWFRHSTALGGDRHA